MLEATSLQDATLTDWFEEQEVAVIPRGARAGPEKLAGIVSISELEEPGAVFDSLSCRDSSFTEDDTRYLTPDLHPYPAKFIPQIPTHLIARLSMPGDVILDPFGGSLPPASRAMPFRIREIWLGWSSFPERAVLAQGPERAVGAVSAEPVKCCGEGVGDDGTGPSGLYRQAL